MPSSVSAQEQQFGCFYFISIMTMMMIKCVMFSWFRCIYKNCVPFALGFLAVPLICFVASMCVYSFLSLVYLCFSVNNVCAIRCTCGARLILNVSFESYNTPKKSTQRDGEMKPRRKKKNTLCVCVNGQTTAQRIRFNLRCASFVYLFLLTLAYVPLFTSFLFLFTNACLSERVRVCTCKCVCVL